MIDEIKMPTQKLPKDMIKVWVIKATISNAIFLLLLLGLFFSREFMFNFEFIEAEKWFKPLLIALFILLIMNGLYSIIIKPFLLQKTWRYDISENYIQLKYGLLVKHLDLIPMSRVEYVNTNQGPILRLFSLSQITIGTISFAHQIPAVSFEDAKRIRELIIHLAKLEEAVDQQDHALNEPLEGDDIYESNKE